MGTIPKFCEENSIDKILAKLMLCGSKFSVNHEDWWVFSRSNFDTISQDEPYHTINLLLNTSSGKYMIRVFGVTRESGTVSSFEQVVAICYKSFSKTIACFGLNALDDAPFRDEVPPSKSENCSIFYKLGDEKSLNELSGRGQCDKCKKELKQKIKFDTNTVDVNLIEKDKIPPEIKNEHKTDGHLEESINEFACDTDSSSPVGDNDSIDNPINCSECHMTFYTIEKLNKHVIKRHVGEHECDFCKKRFFSSRVLSDHRVTHTKERPDSCDECGATFGFNSTYKVHLKMHQRKLAGNKGIIDNKLYYDCKKCNKKFTQIGGLHRHKRHVHEKKFEDVQCELCGANFRTATLFNQHYQRFHTDAPKFKCNVCSVPFGRKEHLVRHLLTHDTNTAHICPHCGRAFKRKDGLTVHLRTHTGDRPFKCFYEGCLWAGLDSSSFSRHKKTVHGVTPAIRCRKTQVRENKTHHQEFADKNPDKDLKEKEVLLELDTDHLENLEIVEPLVIKAKSFTADHPFVQPLDYTDLGNCKFISRTGRIATRQQKETDTASESVRCSITQTKVIGQQQFGMSSAEMSSESLIKSGLLFSQTD